MYCISYIMVVLTAGCAASDQVSQISQNTKNGTVQQKNTGECGANWNGLFGRLSASSYDRVVSNLAYQLACWQGTGTSIVAIYVYYGCWCGFECSGRTMDRIDQCCQAHDLCYRRIAKSYKGLHKWTKQLSFFTKYKVSCSNRISFCHDNGFPRATCDCDRTFASCVNTYKSDWKWRNVYTARKNC